MITRAEYMAAPADSGMHDAYYLEVAAEACVSMPPNLMAEVQRSSCPHLNDVPLPAWDAAAMPYRGAIKAALRRRGDFWSMAGSVCTLKAYAKMRIASEAT